MLVAESHMFQAALKLQCLVWPTSVLWYWGRLLRDPWTAIRPNQSILKEISPGCSLEGLILKLKLQYFGHLMRRVDSLEKALMLGRIGGRRRTEWQWVRWLDDITISMDMGLGRLGAGDGQGGLACCDSWCRKEADWVTELNWTSLLPLWRETKSSYFLNGKVHIKGSKPFPVLSTLLKI